MVNDYLLKHRRHQRILLILALFITVLITILVFSLLYLPVFNPEQPSNRFYILPHLNGIINTINLFLLGAAYLAIQRKRVKIHRNLMLTAFVLSCVFLISYLIYHASVPEVRFGGHGFMKKLYYFTLITHILGSIVVLPLVIFALYYGLTGRYTSHKRIVRWAFPLWIYVAFSGVTIYFLLLPYYPNPFK